MRVVIDTNVIVAGMRSPTGASAALLEAVYSGRVTMVANPGLFFEYEAVLKRPEHLAAAGLTPDDIDVTLKALARLVSAAPGPSLHPSVRDPNDDMV